MPPLFKLLLTSLLQGVVLGWTILAILLIGNFAGISDVVFTASDKWLALFLLAFGFFVTFGSVSMGIAIMFMPYDDERDHRGGGLKLRIPEFKSRIPNEIPASIRVPIE